MRNRDCVRNTAHTVYMQEHEECNDCENDECDCPRDADENRICLTKGCQCAKPEFGETFDYTRCDECDKFLQAIEAAEVEEGCSISEARPMMPMMDDLQGIGREGCKRYWMKALAMFPALRASGHLGRMWRRMF